MRIVYFTHSLASCWNHGNAHFLRGVLSELIARGHDVQVREPEGAWSLANLLADHGEAGLEAYRTAYPELTSTTYAATDDVAAMVDGADLVIVGPGPGDPRDGDHPKIAAFRTAVDDLLGAGQPFLAVCLGHQTLCERLGIPLAFKDIVFQGTQSPIPYRGRTERVGFYNTFVARTPATGLPDEVTVQTDPATGDVHLVAGPHYRGIQFHAESILTQNGYAILRDLVSEILADR